MSKPRMLGQPQTVNAFAEINRHRRQFPKRTYQTLIGKLNYHESTINWAEFGRAAEELCKRLGVDYYIKDSLRREMEE